MVVPLNPTVSGVCTHATTPSDGQTSTMPSVPRARSHPDVRAANEQDVGTRFDIEELTLPDHLLETYGDALAPEEAEG